MKEQVQKANEIYSVLSFLQGSNPGLFLTNLTSEYGYLINVDSAVREIRRKNEQKKDLFFMPNVMKIETIEENGKIYKACRKIKESVIRVQFLFVDLDIFSPEEVRHGNSAELAKKSYEITINKIKEANLPTPNLITYTGRGTHVIWKIDTSTNMELYRKVQKALAKATDGDPQVFNQNRVLRLPFTLNTKYVIQTQVMHFNPNLSYTLEDFAKLLNVEEEETRDEKTIQKATKVIELPKEQLETIAEMLAPFYVPGYRHRLMLSLVAFLLKNGISESSIQYLFDLLTQNDEEKEQRYLQCVKYQLIKAEREGVQNMAGITGLREVIAEQMTAKTGNPGEAETLAKNTISEITRIIEKNIREIYRISSSLFYIITPQNVLLRERYRENGRIKTVEEEICPYPVKVINYDGIYVTLTVTRNGETYMHTLAVEELPAKLPKLIIAKNYQLMIGYIMGVAHKLLQDKQKVAKFYKEIIDIEPIE